ncbi:proline--tRNA ligase [Sulfurovum sp. TSL6]|uniref:proline--tRNA ligase n=1 Tax=Sulfurovum sp. TSL6 TaxID=2826995 RepID=UPI001CC60F41|nr:proline--tRNA ligase [Sulfurovum sp. TSL6]GIT99583.1 proline--tRNA ligase [Sulfurovum sp. TSL6]
MRFSRLLIPTTKETPNDATLASHIYLIRGGFIQSVGGSGLYNFLPLGKKILDKVHAVVKEELDKAGCQEVSLSFVTPAALWEESGRLEKYGKELLRFKDRKNNDFILGPTHEEMMVNLVRQTVKSYKQLPLNVYQINLKFRDEIRPRFGLMRGREFLMKDAYSFHTSTEDMQREFALMEETYKKIFTRLGLEFRVVEADSGAIGGSGSKEFMVLADSGEDTIVVCDECDYGANIEAAVAKPKAYDASAEIKVIAMKALYDEGVSKVVHFALPASVELQDVKACNAVNANDLVEYEESVAIETLVLDSALEGIDDLTAEEKSYADISAVQEGDACASCGGSLRYTKGIEAGHIFQLGTRYSEPLAANFLDENGKSQPMVMGTYGIGVSRLLAAIIEQNHDDKGCIWTKESAPFDLQIIVSNIKDDAQVALGEALYETMLAKGVDVLLDERKDRFGAKMKDYELIGVPHAVVIGKKLADGVVEFMTRDGMIKEEVPAEAITELLTERF